MRAGNTFSGPPVTAAAFGKAAQPDQLSARISVIELGRSSELSIPQDFTMPVKSRRDLRPDVKALARCQVLPLP